MPAELHRRDYSLTGRETRLAEERGLADAQWYASEIPRQRMRELMQRRDGPAILHTLIWFGVLIDSGVLGYLNWGAWWALPCFLVYGVIYGSSMVFRESVSWRWSHTRHHTDTIIVGRDPEIAVPRPPDLLGIAMAFFVLKSAPKEFVRMLKHCFGHLTPAEAIYIPESEHHKVFRNARIYILIYASVVGAAIAARSILPLMYIGLPSLYGSWLMVVFGLTQHAGLAEDVLDHRLNCRTLSWAISSNAPNTTGVSTSPPARPRAPRPVWTSRPIRSSSKPARSPQAGLNPQPHPAPYLQRLVEYWV